MVKLLFYYCISNTINNNESTKVEALDITGVTESIVRYLRIYIIEGELAPGQKLNELELSSWLGISRPPMREAFRILENEHLVVCIPRKGCYVTEMSREDCREVFQAREMIECFAIDILKEENIRALTEVRSALEVTADMPMPGSTDPYEKYNYLKAIANFHIGLVESAGNSRLNRCYHSNFSSLARYQSMYVYIDGLMNKSQITHEQILDYIDRGKYDEAKEKLRYHIRGFLELTERSIDKRLQEVSPHK
jgi:DNA-binding GntR family transcriptional regulator